VAAGATVMGGGGAADTTLVQTVVVTGLDLGGEGFAVDAATLTLHSGEMDVAAALAGCRRSGDSARLKSGLPGSALFGRAKFFLQVHGPPGGVPTHAAREAPGLYDWVVLELPGWWPAAKASGEGEGDLVGDTGRGRGNGEGDGVLARGESGMWPTDFLLAELLLAECSLCLSPCSVDGRW